MDYKSVEAEGNILSHYDLEGGDSMLLSNSGNHMPSQPYTPESEHHFS
jgi:hypothetical protein